MSRGADGHEVLDFEHASRAVAVHARRTPLVLARALSDRFGREVWAKAECLQVTGSFKVRGAASRLAALDAGERVRGVVACSSGNHGRAVAHVAAAMGVPATVFLPEWVDPVKLDGIREAGAEAVLAGAGFDEAEAAALAEADRSARPYVSAYDDPWVIAGQGTVALEVTEQLGRAPGAVLVPLSGGGLVGGMAAALRARCADTHVVAVSATNAAVMLESVRAGRPVEGAEAPTLASALAGGIGPANRHTFALVRDLVGTHVEVSEEAIAGAMRHAVGSLRLVVEGGGAVALAALLDGAWSPSADEVPVEGPVVVVLSGGNVASETLDAVLAGA